MTLGLQLLRNADICWQRTVHMMWDPHGFSYPKYPLPWAPQSLTPGMTCTNGWVVDPPAVTATLTFVGWKYLFNPISIYILHIWHRFLPFTFNIDLRNPTSSRDTAAVQMRSWEAKQGYGISLAESVMVQRNICAKSVTTNSRPSIRWSTTPAKWNHLGQEGRSAEGHWFCPRETP